MDTITSGRTIIFTTGVINICKSDNNYYSDSNHSKKKKKNKVTNQIENQNSQSGNINDGNN